MSQVLTCQFPSPSLPKDNSMNNNTRSLLLHVQEALFSKSLKSCHTLVHMCRLTSRHQTVHIVKVDGNPTLGDALHSHKPLASEAYMKNHQCPGRCNFSFWWLQHGAGQQGSQEFFCLNFYGLGRPLSGRLYHLEAQTPSHTPQSSNSALWAPSTSAEDILVAERGPSVP